MHIVRKIVRILFFILFGAVLLIAGSILALYSPWTQETLRRAVTERFSDPEDVQICLESIRLRPPLRLELAGLDIVQHRDTVISADRFSADIALLPLIGGTASVADASLQGGYYRIGAPDSAMCLNIRADIADISSASVALATMAIDVDDATLSRCRIDMVLNPDTATTPAPVAADKSSSSVRVHTLSLHFPDKFFLSIDSECECL